MELSALRRTIWTILVALSLEKVTALNHTLYPAEYADISCSLSANEEGVCVYSYLCHDGVINTDGAGLVDLRFGDVCEDYFLRCCSKATSCADGEGKCVPKSKCGVNKNLPKYKAFKESQDCNWSGYTCCPKDAPAAEPATTANPTKPIKPGKLITTKKPEPANPDAPEKCDGGKGVCVSRNDCGVNPDGEGLIEERTISDCSSENDVCCPSQFARTSDCDSVGGRCVPAGQCSSKLEFDVREADTSCPTNGHVCCTKAAIIEPAIKLCFNNTGTCSTREECQGRVTRDRRKECDGLICCMPTDPATTVAPVPSSEGKSCFNGGTCTTRENCRGVVTNDGKNECNGLVCCTPKSVATTSTTTEANILGQSCSNGRGQCSDECANQSILKDISNTCDGFDCCAIPSPTDGNCKDIGGTCTPSSGCSRTHEGDFEDCESNQQICCAEVVKSDDEGYNSRGCGYRNDQGVLFKIINDADGESQYGEFPWVVAIFSELHESESKFICGGSLIDPEVILTTADCVKSFRTRPEKLTIRAGEWDMRSSYEPIPHQERGVRLVKTHPTFKQSSLVNNVALLFLEDKFDLTKTIDTACLPPQNFEIFNGDLNAAGWGSTPKNLTKAQQILKSLELPFTQPSDCERTLRRVLRKPAFKLDRSFLCAGGYPDVDTCRGDAGSPVVFPVPNDFQNRMYVVGMVSWGVGCGRAGVPAPYTDVGRFRDWIDAELRKENLAMYSYDYQRNEDDE